MLNKISEIHYGGKSALGGKKIFLFLGFIWVTLILISYFIVTSRLIEYPISNYAERISELSLFCVIIFISLQIGNFFLNKFNLKPATSLKIALASGLGLACFSIITFLAGISGILYKSTFYIIILILFLFSIGNIKYLQDIRLFRFNHGEIFFIFIFLIFLSVAFIGAMAPPTLYDSLVYHLSVPSQYVKHHKIFSISTNLFANFPQNIEMLYTMALVLYDDILANLIHFYFLPLILLLLYGFLKDKLNSKAVITALLIFITTPAVILLACGTYIDLGLTFYLLLSFVALTEWMKTSSNKWLILSGLFCGFSLGIKYTAAVSFAIFTILILYNCIIKKQNVIRDTAIFLISVFIVFLPWGLKNYFFTGNPVFPFFIFTEPPLYVHQYMSHVSCHGTSGFISLINLPWDLTMTGVNFGGPFDVIGPLYLVFLPVLIFIKHTNKTVKICFIYLLLYFLLWSFTARVIRFLAPVFPVAAIVFSACIFQFLNMERKSIRNIVKFVFVIIIICNFLLLLHIQNSFLPGLYFFGNMTRERYLSAFVGPNNFYPAVKFMNKTFTSDSKTLFVGESRNYFTKLNTVVSGPFDYDILVKMANKSATVKDLLTKLKKENFTNILWNYSEYERLKTGFKPSDFTYRSAEILKEFKRKHLKTLYKDKNNSVYEIIQ
ncbi:MAG: glycosyltransferase family 39 protein [Elusimicrobia bacterium]|nr:glycosyltransferase family 39 protein [Elusimicrobiota bacterium]